MESTSEQFARQKIPRTWPGETPTRRRCISRRSPGCTGCALTWRASGRKNRGRGERLKFHFLRWAVSTCLPAGRAARTRWAIGFKEAALCEWTKAHREQYERFLIETLSFPNLTWFPPRHPREKQIFLQRKPS